MTLEVPRGHGSLGMQAAGPALECYPSWLPGTLRPPALHSFVVGVPSEHCRDQHGFKLAIMETVSSVQVEAR